MSWSVEILDESVRAELEALPRDMRAHFDRIARLIEGALWEIRLKGRDGIARAIYVTAMVQRLIVLRVFVKKTQQTPRLEITIALKRAKELS